MAELEQVKKDTSIVIQKIEQRIEGDRVAVFDPRIKFATKKQEQEAAVVWSTKSIELAMQAIEEGQGLRISPFLKSDPNLRKANLLFQYTDEEIAEILKCRKDIVYFAETYVYLKTENGLKHIKLRPYQKQLLKNYQENRWCITLFPRQSGKCFLPSTSVKIRQGNTLKDISMLELYNMHKKHLLFNERLISCLWKAYMYSDIEALKLVILRIISLFTQKSIYDNDDIEHKIIDEIDISSEDIYVKTDTGYSKIKKIYKTRDYEVYRIRTKSGLYLECADKHIVFNSMMQETWIKDLHPGDVIQTQNGPDIVTSIERLGSRVEMYDIELDDINHRYYSNGILSHNTTTTAIFFAWFSIFNTDKNLAVIAQRDQIAAEVFSKIKSIIQYLPFFMKPGCVKFNRGGYHFDNGCTAIYRPASIDALQGYTIDTLFIDEFAYIRNTQARQFWNNVYPTLSSMSNSRVMITSTPNGRNLFYELWSNAIDGKNFFKPLRIDWWEVPGRDEKWRLQEIANLGSEAAFAQQYGLSFDTGVKNSLSADTFHYLNKVSTEFEHDIFKIGTDWDEYFRWSTKWMYNLRKDWFLISVDIGEGLGGDYSVIKIRKLFLNPDGTVIMPTIGVFECNTIIVEDFAKVILLMMRRFNRDHVRLIIERNSYGDLLIKDIESLAEHLTNVEIPVETFAKFRRSADNMKMEKGIRLNRGNKKVGVGNWKKLVDDKIFIETDSRTIDQYREFGEDKNGNYKAGVGHDDLVMPDVNAAFYVKSNNTGWNEFIEDFKEHVTIDSFNTEVMIRYNLVAINEIKKDSAFEGNEYEIIPLEELTDEDIANEYSEIDKYLESPSERKKSKKLKEYESYNEYDMINEANIQLQERRRNKSETNLSREELNYKIAQDLV